MPTTLIKNNEGVSIRDHSPNPDSPKPFINPSMCRELLNSLVPSLVPLSPRLPRAEAPAEAGLGGKAL